MQVERIACWADKMNLFNRRWFNFTGIFNLILIIFIYNIKIPFHFHHRQNNHTTSNQDALPIFSKYLQGHPRPIASG